MIELVLIYCLSDAPDRCIERREPLAGPASALECTINAQAHAQEYVVSHPKYRLARWRCEVDKPAEDPA